VLAFAWGIQFIDPGIHPTVREHIHRAGYFVAFMFLLCGAARLARFNITKNPVPKNPGRPDRKYFVGLPIPAGAGMIAAVVYATDAVPLYAWPFAVAWIAFQLLLAFLMVSTWRYYSFKDINLRRPRKWVTVIGLGALVYLIWNWPQPVLLAMGLTYVGSGIVTRIGGALRRRFRHHELKPESQVG
jgi:CDP-diacylglycerol--serine O-phosphatidyltransferase